MRHYVSVRLQVLSRDLLMTRSRSGKKSCRTPSEDLPRHRQEYIQARGGHMHTYMASLGPRKSWFDFQANLEPHVDLGIFLMVLFVPGCSGVHNNDAGMSSHSAFSFTLIFGVILTPALSGFMILVLIYVTSFCCQQIVKCTSVKTFNLIVHQDPRYDFSVFWAVHLYIFNLSADRLRMTERELIHSKMNTGFVYRKPCCKILTLYHLF